MHEPILDRDGQRRRRRRRPYGGCSRIELKGAAARIDRRDSVRRIVAVKVELNRDATTREIARDFARNDRVDRRAVGICRSRIVQQSHVGDRRRDVALNRARNRKLAQRNDGVARRNRQRSAERRARDPPQRHARFFVRLERRGEFVDQLDVRRKRERGDVECQRRDAAIYEMETTIDRLALRRGDVLVKGLKRDRRDARFEGRRLVVERDLKSRRRTILNALSRKAELLAVAERDNDIVPAGRLIRVEVIEAVAVAQRQRARRAVAMVDRSRPNVRAWVAEAAAHTHAIVRERRRGLKLDNRRDVLDRYARRYNVVRCLERRFNRDRIARLGRRRRNAGRAVNDFRAGRFIDPVAVEVPVYLRADPDKLRKSGQRRRAALGRDVRAARRVDFVVDKIDGGGVRRAQNVRKLVGINVVVFGDIDRRDDRLDPLFGVVVQRRRRNIDARLALRNYRNAAKRRVV